MDYPFMYSDPAYVGTHTLITSSGRDEDEEVVTMTMKSGSYWGDLVEFFLRYLKASGYEVKGEDVRDYLLDLYPEEEMEEEPD